MIRGEHAAKINVQGWKHVLKSITNGIRFDSVVVVVREGDWIDVVVVVVVCSENKSEIILVKKKVFEKKCDSRWMASPKVVVVLSADVDALLW